MKQIYFAQKKPIKAKVFEFKGIRNIITKEGITYNIDGKTHYILEGVDGEKWPIEKISFLKSYVILKEGK